MPTWLIWICGVLVGLTLLVCGTGALLPREHVATAERLVDAPPARVAAIIRDVEAYPSWRPSVDRVEVLGRTAGGGLRFAEHGKDGSIVFLLTEDLSGVRFRSAIETTDLPFGGHWLVSLTPEASGTQVRIEEHGHVSNVVFRFVSVLVIGHEATMRTWLDDLERAVTNGAAPS